jgi:hypothetical protein
MKIIGVKVDHTVRASVPREGDDGAWRADLQAPR